MSIPEFLGNRQNATGLSDIELDHLFKYIVEAFTPKWLLKKGGNPFQLLWNRKDILSTNELYFFADCYKRLYSIDKKWLQHQVTLIKTGERNNLQGAIFEICGLGVLNTPTQRVIPAKENQPGYDGVIQLKEGKQIRLSIKNFGFSAHYESFTFFSSQFEKHLTNLLHEKRYRPIRLYISCLNEYPSKSDWAALNENFSDLLDRHLADEHQFFAIDNIWSINIGRLVFNEADDYFEAKASYTLVITAPFHKNEQNNLISKINEACYNLAQHSKTETDDLRNFVFVHLPEHGSILKCEEWVNNYFNEFPDKPVSGVVLWQPSISINQEKRKGITHCFRFVYRENFESWLSGNQIDFLLPIGMISHEPTEKRLVSFSLPGPEDLNIPLEEVYIYQRGNAYINAKKDDNNEITGNVTELASGVFIHAVFNFGKQGLILSGRFPPVDKLLII